MAEVLLHHHIQGLTDGVHAFADSLRQAGHTVHVPDLFDGPDLPDSLYDELAARGRRPTWAEDSLSAGVATSEEAALLECKEGSVVIRLTRRALWGDRPIEISRSVYRADQHTISFQLGS